MQSAQAKHSFMLQINPAKDDSDREDYYYYCYYYYYYY